MKLLIKGGKLVNPEKQLLEKADVLVENGVITAMESSLSERDAEVVEAGGKLVCPGLIDMHVHLREPGFEHKETIATGTMAAARGGFTAVACMPNTNPVADNAPVIRFILDRAAAEGTVKVYPIGAITKGSKGKEITEMADLKAAGAVAVSDDGVPVHDAGVMRRAMQYASMLGLTVISHCEDKSLVAEGVMHQGYQSTVLGLPGMPAEAEEVMVARDIILAEATGCRVHIAHISTAGAVELVRQAKKRGVKVTCEVTPHHFTLTDQAVNGYDTNTKVNPPLRTAADVAAVKQGLADGTIDVIATDHAPHTVDEKEVEYQYAPFGLVGLETAVGLVFTELVDTGILTVPEAVAKLSTNPARIMAVPGGRLAVGEQADITIIDPEALEKVDPGSFAGKGKNTPFAGRKLKGLPVMTIVKGKIVMKDRRVTVSSV
ncbi:dihydroorotase [Desulfohalotomaculum tongense]|uniref:dihydroorotase n=1 Tax=Desulforadius tongensis TaxID=1216062 RepID=UPI00195EDD70|nr:dihydroorotase [Desulforadius tongensis]MBM7855139.1 dihydroorotase [Desulforadius tongensis]